MHWPIALRSASFAFLSSLLLTGCEQAPKQHSNQASAASATSSPLTPTAPQTTARAAKVLETTQSGLLRIDGPSLVEHIRKTGAKATLVNAWASWCGSCKHELPMLKKVTDELKTQGLELLLVSVDEPEKELSAAALLRELKFDELGYVAARPLGPFKRAMNPRWPGMLPATFLFDEAGKLRYYWGGEAFETELRPIVEAFLRGEHIDGEANLKIATEQ